MAIRAGFGGGLIKEHQIVAYLPLQSVASGAGDVLVCSFQRKRGLFVVEQRWLPLVRVMARPAIARPRTELLVVRVLMTFTASG